MKPLFALSAVPVFRRAVFVFVLPWLVGCTPLFEAKPDLTRFYLLSAPATVRPVEPAHGGATVGLTRIELPAYLRSPAVILRPGGTEVRAAAEARWGEPLGQGLTRVLRDALQAQPGVRSVIVYPAPQALPPQFELSVRVIACEGLVGAAGARARFAAAWELRSTTAAPDAAALAGGVFEAPAAEWPEGDFAALTEKLGAAVGALAVEIAAALPR